MDISLKYFCSTLGISRPTLRRKIEELEINIKKVGKSKIIDTNDVELLVKSFGENIENFTEQFNSNDENISENISPNQLNKRNPIFNENNENVENQFVTYLEKTLDETKEELKGEREKNSELIQKLGQAEGETKVYKEKYYDSQKLLRAPEQKFESLERQPASFSFQHKRWIITFSIFAIVFLLFITSRNNGLLVFLKSLL